MKSLYEYMSMADRELSVGIELDFCPTKAQIAAIDKVLFSYGLVSGCEIASQKPMSPKGDGMASCTKLKATLLGMNFPAPTVIAQQVASALRIPVESMQFDCDGELCDLVPEYEPDFGRIASQLTRDHRPIRPAGTEDPQSLVGDKRIASLIADLEDSRELTDPIEVDLPELMTHIGIAESTGLRVSRGYYVIERTEGGVEILSGPHRERPAGVLVAE